MVSANIYICKYNNGKSILVNYSNAEYTHDGHQVPAKGFIVYEE